MYLIGANLKLETHRPLPLSIKGLLKYPENYEFEEAPIITIEEDEDDDEPEVELKLDDFLADHDYAMPPPANDDDVVVLDVQGDDIMEE